MAELAVNRLTHTVGIKTKGWNNFSARSLTIRRWKNFTSRAGDVWRQKLSRDSLRWETKNGRKISSLEDTKKKSSLDAKKNSGVRVSSVNIFNILKLSCVRKE